LANCLSHGLRKFVEIVDFYQDICPTIIEKLSQVFKYDAESRSMNDDTRLKYHQEHSQPVMFELKEYMTSLLDDHLVEPNSPLGKSIKYMQKNWEKLTRFLTVPGTPIDNNIVERALKIAIRNRKSSMFYKTTYSAEIGGMLTSLIYTCELNQQNPQHYLVGLQTHQDAVLADPSQWMPWNYLETINLVTSANPQAHSPPVDLPVVA
jgi:transposase